MSTVKELLEIRLVLQEQVCKLEFDGDDSKETNLIRQKLLQDLDQVQDRVADLIESIQPGYFSKTSYLN